ncbi:MAG: coiled-coil domain-containing protein [Planctomycetota bacterium]|jgi:hypothetical protein
MRTVKISLILGFVLFLAIVLEAEPVGTKFTYQGRLIDANNAADGFYDFQFRLYDDPNTGSQQGSTIDLNDLDVIDGYFTVELDFGSDVFDGNSVWLEIGVRPDDSNDVYTILSPRQEVTPMPYAIYAKTAGGDNDWTVSGSDMYSIPSGKVGIGTMTPSEKLNVIGNTHISGQAAVGTTVDSFRGLNVYRYQSYNPAYGGYFNAQGHEVRGTAYGIYADASTDDENAYGIYATASSTWATPYAGYFDAGDVVVADGDVGIGTTDPKARLHVSRGSILLDNSYGLVSMDNSYFLRRLLYLNDLNNVVLTNSAGGNIFLGTYTSPGSTLVRMTVTPAGNVGIGTTNPAYKLDVEGTVQANAYDTGDIFFRKEGERLWRMFEDEAGLYLENLRTSKVHKFVLQVIQEENETERAVDFDVVIDELKAENESLKQRIEALETIVQQLVKGRKFKL